MASEGIDLEAALRIAARVRAGAVSETRSSGQTITALDGVLRGRDPRDAWRFAQWLWGTCSTAHTIAAVRAVEEAIGLEIPANAQYVRNLILALHALHDHITHFYQQASLDWVDVASAAAADPVKASQLAGSWWGGTGRQPRAPAGRPGSDARDRAGARTARRGARLCGTSADARGAGEQRAGRYGLI